MRRIPFALWALLCSFASAQPLDLIVRNARVWTGDPKRPWADSLAVSGDTIVAVGGIQGKAPTEIDAQGRLITPGFIDSHIHMIQGGMRLNSVQLRDAKTRAQFADRIAKFAATLPEGTWITGGDWDHQQWGGELPTRQWIDAVTPKHPVWVNRLDGHMALANTLALRQAGVTRRTIEVAGGTIVRDAAGEPTGIFKDNAMDFVAEHVPAPSHRQLGRAIDAAREYLLSHGVTSVHHMGSWEDLAAFQEAQAEGRLGVRVYAAVRMGTHKQLREHVEHNGRGDRWLRVGVLKGFMDGSLGSHTAAFHEPYSDAPKDTGLLVTAPDQMQDWVFSAKRDGLHVAIHAIGDRGNTMVLDLFERVGKVMGPTGHRDRIEHAQHLKATDIRRFAFLGIVASMQPYHAIDDGRWAEISIGAERAKTTYAFRSLLDAKATLAFGSDWYVAPPNVMEGIYAAVTRRTLDGKHPNGWVPSEKITVEEALRAYTWGGAYAAFEESYKGTLAPNRLADFVMLDRDITRIPAEQIRDVKVVMTVVGGQVAYKRGGK